jgi:hypothetical protein
MSSILYNFWILIKLEFLATDFRKKVQVSNFIDIRLVGAEVFHAEGQADRRTNMAKLTVAFRNYANAPSKRPRHSEHFLETRRTRVSRGHDS